MLMLSSSNPTTTTTTPSSGGEQYSKNKFSLTLSATNTTTTMEEVWKDINLASLNHHSTRPTFGFQDFLARPFTINNNNHSSSSSSSSSYCAGSPSPSPQQNALTALSLSSRPHNNRRHPLIGPHKPHGPNNLHPVSAAASKGVVGVSCFGGGTTVSPPSPFETTLPCFGTNGFPEPTGGANRSGEKRNKRMIKNRESAARSRARKQAYTNELQLKVDHLMEENARLKRQQQQLYEAAASQQKKRSTTLYRTSTAPF